MPLQFQDIFARERIRPGEIQGQAFVQHFAGFTHERTILDH